PFAVTRSLVCGGRLPSAPSTPAPPGLSSAKARRPLSGPNAPTAPGVAGSAGPPKVVAPTTSPPPGPSTPAPHELPPLRERSASGAAISTNTRKPTMRPPTSSEGRRAATAISSATRPDCGDEPARGRRHELEQDSIENLALVADDRACERVRAAAADEHRRHQAPMRRRGALLALDR